MRKGDEIVSREIALDFVRDPFVWFSPPAKFNDPFEFNPRVKIGFKGDALKQFLQAHSLPGDTPMREAEVVIARKLHSETRVGYRVMCFTEDPLSLPMWAHYGGEHRGIVLGFDSAIIEPFRRLSHNVYGGPVEYSDKRPIVSIEEQDFHEDTMKVIFTKSEAWEYEREWRIALLNQTKKEGAPLNFPLELLRCIVVGHRCSKDERRAIKTALRANQRLRHVDLLSTHLDHEEFRLVLRNDSGHNLDLTYYMNQFERDRGRKNQRRGGTWFELLDKYQSAVSNLAKNG